MIEQLRKLLINPYYRSSVLFYLVLIILVSVLGWLSQNGIKCLYGQMNTGKINLLKERNEKIVRYIEKICFWSAFFLLWFFSAFAACGTDREAYGIIFQDSTIFSIFDGWQEPGFIIFNLVFRLLGDNPRIIYIAISTVTLVLFFVTLEYLKDEINVAYALLAYGCLYYVQSLSLMRMYLAASMLFWGIRYLKEEKYWKYGIVVCITGLTHYSSFLIIVPVLLLYFMYSKKYKVGVHIICISTILMGGVLVLMVGAPLLGDIVIFSRFQRYLEGISTVGIGVVQFVYFIPLFLLLWMVYLGCNENYQRVFFIFTAFAFWIALVSYLIPMLGRAFALFPMIYFWMVPYSMKKLKGCLRKKWSYRIVSVLVMVYFWGRFLIYISEYSKLDEIIPYMNCLF